ncbi:MAG: NAD(P)/FAD-dependent oxidoreductase [Caldithrix sp.]|nr:NAD(P)/FAD-dependent oxidoreductase [Caldithrix sp.]
MIHAQVIIVGGGPAGAACAGQLKTHGIETIILDKSKFPRNKPCAGWLTPRVFRLLNIKPSEYPHNLRKFHWLHFRINGKPLPVLTRQYAIRRYEFDHWLIKKSAATVYHHKVQSIRQQNDQYIIDDRFSCDTLIGAGGSNCPVYHAFFKTIVPRRAANHIATLETEFQIQHHERRCLLWFFEHNLPGYAWYVPKQDTYLNIGLGGKMSMQAGPVSLRSHWQRLIRKLVHKGFIAPETAPQPQGYHYYLRDQHKPWTKDRLYIIGDAAGLATKDLGEGIAPAIASGQMAAHAIAGRTVFNLDQISKYSWPQILWPSFKP